MKTDDIHVGYYVRQLHAGIRYLTVGQGPLVQAISLTHVSPCFAVFANLTAPFVEQPSTLSKVARDGRTGELLETFARPVDINSVVGWLLLGGDRYIRSAVDAINERGLVSPDEGRSLWFEFDRATGALVSAGAQAADRMDKAWTEPWPHELVIAHFAGGRGSMGMLTEDVDVAGLSDLNGTRVGNPIP
jgi:hypothetical protein